MALSYSISLEEQRNATIECKKIQMLNIPGTRCSLPPPFQVYAILRYSDVDKEQQRLSNALDLWDRTFEIEGLHQSVSLLPCPAHHGALLPRKQEKESIPWRARS